MSMFVNGLKILNVHITQVFSNMEMRSKPIYDIPVL